MPVKKTTEKTTQTKKKSSVKKENNLPKLEDFLGEIQKKAYDIYVERMAKNLPGDELSDWLKAEKEIKEKYNIK